MKRSITYKSVPVKNVSLRFLKNVARRSTIYVGIDIGKYKLYVTVRWTPPRSKAVVYEHPWFVENTREIPALVAKLRKIANKNKLIVGIESTGSYGDPLRQALADAEIVVHQVRTKVTHDYAEVFDGVPSQHDGKDAAIIAELVSQGKSTIWSYESQSETENEIRYQVKKMIDIHKEIKRMQGKLEGLLARYWPEITSILALTSITLLKLLRYYGGPGTLHQDKESAQKIRQFSNSRINEEKSKDIRNAAKQTCGVRQGTWDMQTCKDIAIRMLELHKQSGSCKKRLKTLVEQSCTQLQRLSKILGVGTASVVWCHIGDPRRYHCSDAWIKAMGLNLVERSSGEYQSEVRISKRGDSETRRWLYMSALRWIQQSPVKQWYQRKKLQTGKKIPGEKNKLTGGKAVVAVMRKLLKGLWYAIVHDIPFDGEKLFFKEGSRRKDAIPRKAGRRPRRKKTKKVSRSDGVKVGFLRNGQKSTK